MKNTIKGFPSLAIYIDICLQNIYKTKGVALKKIIYDWDKIVGNNLAEQTLPYKISTNRNQKDAGTTLHIFVANGAVSSQLYYMTNLILEKIATYVGSNYISQVKYEINHRVEANNSGKDELINLNKVPEVEIEGIEDELLKSSLQKLAKTIIAANQKGN